MKNKFIVVIPLYNASKWINKCLKSLILQDYENFECIVMDDCSTDNSFEIAEKTINNNGKFTLVKNSFNVGPLANAYNGAMKKSTSSEDIIVILDGDDFFASNKTLSILNNYYNEDSCWMTYGSYINLSTKTRGKFSQQIPQYIIDENAYRQFKWSSSHLRSYKKFLLDKIDPADLKDIDGQFYKTAGDLAVMFPMLEMSGNNAKFIKEILYIWNDLNDLNEHKDKRTSQLNSEKTIRQSKKYFKLLGR